MSRDNMCPGTICRGTKCRQTWSRGLAAYTLSICNSHIQRGSNSEHTLLAFKIYAKQSEDYFVMILKLIWNDEIFWTWCYQLSNVCWSGHVPSSVISHQSSHQVVILIKCLKGHKYPGWLFEGVCHLSNNKTCDRYFCCNDAGDFLQLWTDETAYTVFNSIKEKQHKIWIFSSFCWTLA